MLRAEKADNGQCRLFLEGEATIYAAAQLKEEMAPFVIECEDVCIDLSAVSEIDTSCFQLLIQAKQEFDRKGGNWQMVGHSPAVLEALELLKMENFFGDPLVLPADR